VLADQDGYDHKLQTPNEGINQKNLKIWADLAVPKNLGVGSHFRPAVKAISSLGICSPWMHSNGQNHFIHISSGMDLIEPFCFQLDGFGCCFSKTIWDRPSHRS
jgi:hypothetical protein